MTAIVIAVIVEASAHIYFYRLESRNKIEKGMYRYDAELGWILNDGKFRQVHYDFEVEYAIENGKRLTINRAASSDASLNLYGDSFTFGVGVADRDTIASKLAEKVNLIVNNYGVSGYGPDQYWIRYKKSAGKNDYNIFLIYTGNDYVEINTRTAGFDDKEKPFFEKIDDNYKLVRPQMVYTQKNADRLKCKTGTFFKQVTKQIPVAIKIRSYFVRPDYKYIKEAIERFSYIYKNMGENDIFVIVPSLSLVKGISVRTNEGLFESELETYLNKEGYKHLNLYRSGILSLEDYFKHEGHPNLTGNNKIAIAIAEYMHKVIKESNGY
jgi:hypothetical protein